LRQAEGIAQITQGGEIGQQLWDSVSELLASDREDEHTHHKATHQDEHDHQCYPKRWKKTAVSNRGGGQGFRTDEPATALSLLSLVGVSGLSSGMKPHLRWVGSRAFETGLLLSHLLPGTSRYLFEGARCQGSEGDCARYNGGRRK